MFTYEKRTSLILSGSHYFRIENERKEYFYILIVEPNTLQRWMLGENYCVIQDAELCQVFCQILQLSNIKSLTTAFWNKYSSKIPKKLLEFIHDDIQFEPVVLGGEKGYYFEKFRASSDLDNSSSSNDYLSSSRSDGFDYPPPIDFTDYGSSSSDSSSGFDFGGGDTGGGGAGGDY